MELQFEDRSIIFQKTLNSLDRISLDFSDILIEAGINHCFVSGYVAILFGRNRSSEDIDVIMEQIPYDRFEELWNRLHGSMECIISHDCSSVYHDYLMKRTATRFSNKGRFIPNIELKFTSNELHRKAVDAALIVTVNERTIPISPLELQVAYKLFLGSEKDIEDARFLYKLFSENLDRSELEKYINIFELNENDVKKHLG